MKHIVAFIKPYRVTRVVQALQKIDGLTGLNLCRVRGFGRGRAKNVKEKFTDEFVDYVEHVKVEVFCRDDLAERIVSTIEQEAHTGLRGDGKIYISPVENAVRISTGEHGESAV